MAATACSDRRREVSRADDAVVGDLRGGVLVRPVVRTGKAAALFEVQGAFAPPAGFQGGRVAR